MSLSGLVGFVIGDYFLFASYTLIQARFSQLIMTLAPPFAAVFGFFLLRERNDLICFAGYGTYVNRYCPVNYEKAKRIYKSPDCAYSSPWKAYSTHWIGALGQGVGIVLSKQGMLAYEKVHTPIHSLYIPLAATQIRTIVGALFVWIRLFWSKAVCPIYQSFKDKKSIGQRSHRLCMLVLF